jgi:hypothetical protein
MSWIGSALWPLAKPVETSKNANVIAEIMLFNLEQ